jgi:hypothetical protein
MALPKQEFLDLPDAKVWNCASFLDAATCARVEKRLLELKPLFTKRSRVCVVNRRFQVIRTLQRLLCHQ